MLKTKTVGQGKTLNTLQAIGFANTQIDPSGQQVLQYKRHNKCAVLHVLNAHPFVRLMRQIENAGAIGNAVFQASDPVDVFLVIGAGTDDIIGLARQNAFNCSRG